MRDPQKPSCSWFGDFQTCPWPPKPILFILGDTRTLQLNQANSRFIFENIVENRKIMGTDVLENCGKDGCRKTAEGLLNKFLKCWLWDQYLSKDMKWCSNLWIFETSEIRNFRFLFELRKSLYVMGLQGTTQNARSNRSDPQLARCSRHDPQAINRLSDNHYSVN